MVVSVGVCLMYDNPSQLPYYPGIRIKFSSAASEIGPQETKITAAEINQNEERKFTFEDFFSYMKKVIYS